MQISHLDVTKELDRSRQSFLFFQLPFLSSAGRLFPVFPHSSALGFHVPVSGITDKLGLGLVFDPERPHQMSSALPDAI